MSIFRKLLRWHKQKDEGIDIFDNSQSAEEIKKFVNKQMQFWDNYQTDYQKGLLPEQIAASYGKLQWHLEQYKTLDNKNK